MFVCLFVRLFFFSPFIDNRCSIHFELIWNSNIDWFADFLCFFLIKIKPSNFCHATWYLLFKYFAIAQDSESLLKRAKIFVDSSVPRWIFSLPLRRNFHDLWTYIFLQNWSRRNCCRILSEGIKQLLLESLSFSLRSFSKGSESRRNIYN